VFSGGMFVDVISVVVELKGLRVAKPAQKRSSHARWKTEILHTSKSPPSAQGSDSGKAVLLWKGLPHCTNEE